MVRQRPSMPVGTGHAHTRYRNRGSSLRDLPMAVVVVGTAAMVVAGVVTAPVVAAAGAGAIVVGGVALLITS